MKLSKKNLEGEENVILAIILLFSDATGVSGPRNILRIAISSLGSPSWTECDTEGVRKLLSASNS